MLCSVVMSLGTCFKHFLLFCAWRVLGLRVKNSAVIHHNRRNLSKGGSYKAWLSAVTKRYAWESVGERQEIYSLCWMGCIYLYRGKLAPVGLLVSGGFYLYYILEEESQSRAVGYLQIQEQACKIQWYGFYTGIKQLQWNKGDSLISWGLKMSMAHKTVQIPLGFLMCCSIGLCRINEANHF